MLTLDIFIHTDAVDRREWQGAPDDRPLTDLGKQQALRLAEELTSEPVAALYTSVALRCRESMEPFAARTSLRVRPLPGFQDTGDNAFDELLRVHAEVPDGRAVLCSYGDVVPALLVLLAERWGVSAPPRDNRKGAVFTIEFDGKGGALSSRAPSADFPQ